MPQSKREKLIHAKKGKLKLSEIDLHVTNAPNTFNLLETTAKERILHDTGIPKKNFEPFTIDDIRKTAKLNYSQLDPKLKRKVSNKIGEISEANMRNQAFVH